MTGYTVHTGASKKFVKGWDAIFGGKPSAKPSSAKKSSSSGGTKTPRKKPTAGKKKKSR